MSEDLPAKHYQKTKKGYEKNARESYQNLSEEEKAIIWS